MWGSKLPLLMTAREGPRQLCRRSYAEGDEHLFEPRADFARGIAKLGKVGEGPKWTMTRGGAPILVGGMTPQWRGNWNCWFYASALTPREWRFAMEAAMDCVRWAFREGGAATVEALADEASPCAQAMLAAFGWRDIGHTWPAPDGSRQRVYSISEAPL